MDPLTMTGALVAGQAISGLVQYYSAEKARGASQAQLQKIQDLYNQIKPPDYDLSITAPPQYHQEAIASPNFINMVQSPNFDMSKYTPEKLQQVAQYVPTIAPLIKEAAPTLIQNSDAMKTGRSAQMAALQKLTQIGQGGFDPEYQQKVQQAAMQAQNQAQSRQQSLMDSFARRGISGSGLELAANMSGNAQSMNQAAMANQQAATDAYRNQMQALAQSGQLGGQIFGQDEAMQGQNAAIINAFNQRMTAAQQNYEQQRALALTDAQAKNTATAQDLANQNVNNANNATLADRQRADQLAQFGYNASMQNAQMQNQNQQLQYQNAVNSQQYQNQLAQSLAQWQQQQKDSQNALKTQQYNNAMNKAAGLSGMYQGQANNILQNASDRNAAIGGFTSGLSALGMNYANQQNNAQLQKNAQNFQDTMYSKYGYNPSQSNYGYNQAIS